VVIVVVVVAVLTVVAIVTVDSGDMTVVPGDAVVTALTVIQW
jgi:hypothetical protein